MYGHEEKVPSTRLALVRFVIVAVFLFLIWGFWRLQVLRRDYYVNVAVQNRVKEVPILAPRGRLLDREGRLIVENYPSFSALLVRSQGKFNEANLEAIARGLNLDPDEVKEKIRRQTAQPGYQPLYLKTDITPDELAFIEAHRNEYPELDTITMYRRLYPKNGFMAHLIGYVGEVSENMLNSPRFELYNPGDVVGQSGIEAEYNDVLMGKNGSRRVLVNSRGKEVGELGDTPAVPGKPLRLTIDLDLQIAAEQALGDKPGAIVAMDPKTGEVLAMVSRPTFDPNAFAVQISSREWRALLSDPGNPLLNKAIQAQLAPGSVFKIIMSAAGWQEGIAQNLHIHCGGGGTFYGRYFKCWRKEGHGSVGLTKGIYQSCDVFFYTLAERLGIGRMAKYATEFGLGQKTGIDLPQEAQGVMPSEEWKARNFRQKWYAGETISVGIGQGAVTTTPIQLMRAIGAIAMGGQLVRPHLVLPDEMPEWYRKRFRYTETKILNFDPKGWETITDAMTEVLEPEGTAPSAHIAGLDIGGKTGSAQMISNALWAKLSVKERERYKDNGWFVGFTPRRNPDVVVAVLYQGGEHGSSAARLATKVLQAYEEKKHHRSKEQARPPAKKHEHPPAAGGEEPAPASRPAPGAAAGQQETAEPAEMTGIWSEGEGTGHWYAARFRLRRGEGSASRAVAAPGLEEHAEPACESPKPCPHAAARDSGKRHPAQKAGLLTAAIPAIASAVPAAGWKRQGAVQ